MIKINNKHKEYLVDKLDRNQRIDNVLVKYLNINKSNVNKLIDNKLVFVNNQLVSKNGYKVFKDDVIQIEESIENKITINTFKQNINIDLELPILYEDEYCWIFNKPNDLLVYDNMFNESMTLANYLKQKYPNLDFIDNVRYGIVHRLDRKTSGIILVAKNEKSYNKFQQLLFDKQIIRKYKCIVHNCFDSEINKFKIDNIIGRSKRNKYKMQVNSSKDGKQAITIVNVIENLSNTHALVDCELITGRTHQIRVHMKYINHPIVNDELYGIEKEFEQYGQYLYCYNLSFNHPFTNKNINITLEEPIEFSEKIKQIKNE